MKQCEKLVYGRLISCAIERLRAYQHITAPKVIRHVYREYVIVEFEGNLRYMLKLCSGYWLYHRVELTPAECSVILKLAGVVLLLPKSAPTSQFTAPDLDCYLMCASVLQQEVSSHLKSAEIHCFCRVMYRLYPSRVFAYGCLL